MCDVCGEKFTVELEPSYKPPRSWSLYEVAEDAVRGAIDYRPEKDEVTPEHTFALSCSVSKDNKHLCGTCTWESDNKGK